MSHATSMRRAVIGALWWCAVVWLRVPSAWHGAWASALVVFAALVIVPLAWPLLGSAEESGLVRWAARLQLVAAMLLSFAVWLPRGKVALGCALPWIAVTMLLAIDAAREITVGRRGRRGDAIGRGAAHVFVAIGGGWLAADRAGVRPLGFSEDIVLLTAVYFHYAGLVLPLVAGAVARERASVIARVGAWGVVSGVPLVAAGITTAQLHGSSWVEAMAAVWLGASGFVVAAGHLGLATERAWPKHVRVCWAVAGASLACGMTLAILYGIRHYAQPWPWLDLPWMRVLHGTANALGFAFSAVLGWRWARVTEARD